MKAIVEIRDRQIKMVRLITESACKEFDNCVTVTSPILEINESFRFVHEALAELIDWQNSFIDEGENLFYNIHNAERKVRAFLFEVRSYLDHMQTTLSRKFGEDSEELQLFLKATNDAYDNVAAYAFAYHLRDYSQHCGNIVNCLSENPKTGKTSAYALVSKLKEQNSKNWKSVDIKFLDAQQDGKVDLLDLLVKTYQALDQRVHVKVMKRLINQNDAGNCLKWLREYADMNFGRENVKYFHYADMRYKDGNDATIDDYNAGKKGINFTVTAIDWRAVYQATDSMGVASLHRFMINER